MESEPARVLSVCMLVIWHESVACLLRDEWLNLFVLQYVFYMFYITVVRNVALSYELHSILLMLQ